MNETGRKTFFWYRIYCATLILTYLALTIFGIFLAVVQPQTPEYTPQETMFMGILCAVLGGLFCVIAAVAIFLPPKPYNWIIGMVMIAIGMTSCCFLPFMIPLIYFWIKPETQAFFGRK